MMQHHIRSLEDRDVELCIQGDTQLTSIAETTAAYKVQTATRNA